MMIRLENHDLYGPGQRGSETAVVVILDSVFSPLVLVLVRNLRRRKHVSSLVTIRSEKGITTLPFLLLELSQQYVSHNLNLNVDKSTHSR